MASELPNCKNIIYIPSSSPPPIDVLPDENDFDIADTDEAYDITGLSQKFECEEFKTTQAYSTITDINLEFNNEIEPSSISNIVFETTDGLSSNDKIEINDLNSSHDNEQIYASKETQVCPVEETDKYCVTEKIAEIILQCNEPEICKSENEDISTIHSMEVSNSPVLSESSIGEKNEQIDIEEPIFEPYQDQENSELKLNDFEQNIDNGNDHNNKDNVIDTYQPDTYVPDLCNDDDDEFDDFRSNIIIHNDGENSDEDFSEFHYTIEAVHEDEVTDDFGDFYSSNDVVSISHMNEENYTDEFQYEDPGISYTRTLKSEEHPTYNNDNDTKIIKNNEETLQLEFSDDDEEYNFEERFSITEEDSIRGIGLEDEKFHWLILKWIPLKSSCTSGGSCSFSNYTKLSDLVEDTFIWFHVANVESCLALQFSWTNSRMNKLYLTSLNVDTRNILVGHRSKWISTIPLFAQALSFSPLTPLRPSNNSVSWDLEESSSTKNSAFTFVPQQIDASLDPTPSRDMQQNCVPPVEFDWKSSGLTNPFSFSGNEILSTPKQDSTPLSTIELKRTSPPPAENDFRSAGQTLSDLAIYSSEVEKVLRHIPDLNFMRSKVLMFPIKETSSF